MRLNSARTLTRAPDTTPVSYPKSEPASAEKQKKRKKRRVVVDQGEEEEKAKPKGPSPRRLRSRK